MIFDGRPLTKTMDHANGNSVLHPILVIGPPPSDVGGMASVVAQSMTLQYDLRYEPILLPITQRNGGRERVTRRVKRHVDQFRRIRSIIKTRNVSIVHLHTCSGWSFFRSCLDMVWAIRLGCRVVLHIHGAMFDSFHARQPHWRKRLIRIALTRADAVIALSSSWKSKLRAMAPNARIEVVENAVHVPAGLRPLAPGGHPCRFLLLARMDTWKGVDDLLDACAILRRDRMPFSVTLAGPPGTAGDAVELKRKIASRRLQSRVEHVGTVEGESKEALFSSSDVYVQPSRHEGMPIALLEALAHGLPVVATSVGAVPEVITEGREGLLVPPRRVDRLAGAMREIAAHQTLRHRMSRASYVKARERFSLERLERDLVAVYDKLMTLPRRSMVGRSRRVRNRKWGREDRVVPRRGRPLGTRELPSHSRC